MKYTLFPNAPQVDLIEPKHGEIMEVGNFLQLCICGYFTDYDGYARFIVNTNDKDYEIRDVKFCIDEDAVYFEEEVIGGIFWFCNTFGIKKIIWFNK